jgi:peptidoglycan endopeptidase LytE
VGIYLGDNRFVHASSRERKVTVESLDTPYYVKRYIGAKRLLFEENESLPQAQ